MKEKIIDLPPKIMKYLFKDILNLFHCPITNSLKVAEINPITHNYCEIVLANKIYNKGTYNFYISMNSYAQAAIFAVTNKNINVLISGTLDGSGRMAPAYAAYSELAHINSTKKIFTEIPNAGLLKYIQIKIVIKTNNTKLRLEVKQI
jgi:hypothetical protein